MKKPPKDDRGMEFVKRRKRDEFFWYLNDVLVEYSPGPSTFLQYREDYPDITIKAWADEGSEIALYLYVEKIKGAWWDYSMSPYPEETRKELSGPEFVRSLFKENLPVVLNGPLLDRFGKALVKALPSREHTRLDLPNLPEWLHLDQVIRVALQLEGKKWSKEKIRKLPLGKFDPEHKGQRKRDLVFKHFGYTPPDPPEKD